jgi:hypothetical protein
MPYIENRLVHDADAHLMELPDGLDACFDPRFLDTYHDLPSCLHKMMSPMSAWDAPYRDYPHVEGGRNPLERLGESLRGAHARAIARFYADNFVDPMGEGLAPDLRRPEPQAAA